MVDQTSIGQLARSGYRGGRIFCRVGCTDLWIKARLVIFTVPEQPDGRGKYERIKRAFECVRCHQLSQTRGVATKRCQACQQDAQRERDHARWVAKRRRTA